MQVLDNMEASCVSCVKVGTLDQLEQSNICVLADTKMGIVIITVQHDSIVTVSLMRYPSDFVRQTSPDIISVEECPPYI